MSNGVARSEEFQPFLFGKLVIAVGVATTEQLPGQTQKRVI